ncbi:MAG TPA: hypothetical protein VEZ12_07110 [Herpetosiphonaceae bacterium]|nr:hypothetical protein [Herpetosiphonaceae bacterium]
MLDQLDVAFCKRGKDQNRYAVACRGEQDLAAEHGFSRARGADQEDERPAG